MSALFNNLNPFGPNSNVANATEATVASSVSEDNDESFVQVMETGGTATLELKVAPRNDAIGVGRSEEKTQICATITAFDTSAEEELKTSARAPVDIVVALDISASMSGRKLDLCKHTLELLLRELRHEDRFGLITFSDEANIAIPTRKLTNQGKQDALRKIKKVHTIGCTNLSGGVSLAAQDIRAVEEPNSVRAIFLLTDGQANRGVCNPDDILSLTRGCLIDEGGPPSTIHTFGYGSDHDEDLLRKISTATPGGTYYFVDSDSNVVTAFGDALGGILSVVAQNCILDIAVPAEAASLGAKIIGIHHDSAVQKEDGSYSINIGDFYAEESRDVLLEVCLANTEWEQRIPHISVKMSYVDTIKKNIVSNVKEMGYITRHAGFEMSPPNNHVVIQWLRIRTTYVMEKAKEEASKGNLENARATIKSHLDGVRREAKEIDAESDPLVIQVIADLNEVLAGLSTKTSYDTYGSKYVSQRIHTHTTQRCAESGATTMNVYRSLGKAKMTKKFAGGMF